MFEQVMRKKIIQDNENSQKHGARKMSLRKLVTEQEGRRSEGKIAQEFSPLLYRFLEQSS